MRALQPAPPLPGMDTTQTRLDLLETALRASAAELGGEAEDAVAAAVIARAQVLVAGGLSDRADAAVAGVVAGWIRSTTRV